VLYILTGSQPSENEVVPEQTPRYEKKTIIRRHKKCEMRCFFFWLSTNARSDEQMVNVRDVQRKGREEESCLIPKSSAKFWYPRNGMSDR
jgi:hypothetical protein